MSVPADDEALAAVAGLEPATERVLQLDGLGLSGHPGALPLRGAPVLVDTRGRNPPVPIAAQVARDNLSTTVLDLLQHRDLPGGAVAG